jgi:predicted DNA-binding transcriptional regulator AlpA
VSENLNTAPSIAPALLRIEQVAQLAQLPVRTIRHRCALGVFPPPVAFGRSKRWHRETLERWFAQGCPPLDRFERAS